MDMPRDSLTGSEGAGRAVAFALEQEIRRGTLGAYYAAQEEKLRAAGAFGEMLRVTEHLVADTGTDRVDDKRGQAFHNGVVMAIPAFELITGLSLADVPLEEINFRIPEAYLGITDKAERRDKIANSIRDWGHKDYKDRAGEFHKLVEAHEAAAAENDPDYTAYVRCGFGFAIELAQRVKNRLVIKGMEAEFAGLELDDELKSFFDPDD